MNYSDYIKNLEDTFTQRKCCIFGSGVRGKECQQYLLSVGIRPWQFFDNNRQKAGELIVGTSVSVPQYKENVVVIITVLHHYDEIRKQLIELGYSSKDIFTYEDVLVLYYEKNIENKHMEQKNICEYPETIQLPITHLCNFNCVMCGMNKLIREKDFTPEELELILKDKLFKKVRNVGVNGGEPFMRKDFLKCMNVLVDSLPLLKNIDIISNGYFTSKIVEDLETMKKMCEPKGVHINLAISVDGVEDMQDFHRGKKGAFLQANETCKKILEHKERLVDRLDVICTITKYNIRRINEVVIWAEDLGIDVSYNIATENVRISNQERTDDFSIFADKQAHMLATEFFYNEYRKTQNEKYYALFLYLRDGKRYADCPCMHNEWITLTPDSEIRFCATRSKKLGSGLQFSPYELVANNMEYLGQLQDEYCERCSHYAYKLNALGLKELLKERLRNGDMG